MQIKQREPLRLAEQRWRRHDDAPEFLPQFLNVTLGGNASIPFFCEAANNRIRRLVNLPMRTLRRCEVLSLLGQFTVAQHQ